MREIKFRVWDGQRMRKSFDLSQNPVFWWEENYDYPLMQYTGLKDKNGVEIFEGDLIRTPQNEIGEVEWQAGIAGLSIDYGRSPVTGKHYYGLDAHEFIEIIGNTYENPELLEAAS